MEKFKTLIIDPPWPYERASGNSKLSGYVIQEGNSKYKTLTISDLKKLPINDVMHPDEAYVFLWTTGSFTEDAYGLMRAWGFIPKTQLCWCKSDKGLGVGYWFRGNHELVLVGKRAAAPSIRTGESSLIIHPRIGHSTKPATLHEIIEKRREPYTRKDKNGNILGVVPTSFPGPFLEIFAREKRDGWTVLGNEAPGDLGDIRDTLPELIAKISNEPADTLVVTSEAIP